ncbi:MAG TPA: hypothetical protein VF242_02590 [Nitrososphaeraceae archaeon]
MPNLDPWLNQNEYHQRISTAESIKLEKHLLSIRTHNQKQKNQNVILPIKKIMKRE